MRRHDSGYTGAGSTFDEKDGWSSSGKLTVGASGQPITMQAAFPVADLYTVQFAVAPPADAAFRAVATITWTVEGNQITRMVDVSNGVSVSAPSQAVHVRVNDQTTADIGTPTGQQYGVTISVTRGSRPFTGQPPTLAANQDNEQSVVALQLAPSLSVTYTIPQGAGVSSAEVSAAVSLGANPADLLIQQASPTQIIKQYNYTDKGPEFVAMSPLATKVVLTNLSALTIVVSVTWGIDG